jgi:hypothetical protein
MTADREANVRIGDMQHWFNQHSFLIAAATAILLLAIVLLRDGVRPSDLFALGALCLGLALAYVLLRPGESTRTQVEAVQAEIGRGVPVLLEFQSPY